MGVARLDFGWDLERRRVRKARGPALAPVLDFSVEVAVLVSASVLLAGLLTALGSAAVVSLPLLLFKNRGREIRDLLLRRRLRRQ